MQEAKSIVYEPPPSLVPFFFASKFVNLVVGPVGSTKTTAGIIKILYEAKKVAACGDGIRRSRCVVVRNTRQQLYDTTIPDFLKWYPEGVFGVFMRTESKFMLRFGDVECEVMFRGLDDANDVRRLLSLQITFGMMDEFREIHPDIYAALAGRLGRYPDKSMNGVGPVDDEGNKIDKLWGMSNPPDMGSFWEDVITNPPDNVHVSIQPSARSPEADWIGYLKEGYYDNLIELNGRKPGWVDVYVDAKFGSSLAGKPVFPTFDRSIHVSKEPLRPTRHLPLIIGVDAGLNPTAVITQQTVDGRVLVYDAVTGHEGGMGARRFCRELLKPLIVRKYPEYTTAIVIDPAAFQRSQTDERTVADVFRSEGFSVKAARTNNIAARIAVVEKFLTGTANNQPTLMLDIEGTKLLQLALAGKYRYKVNTKGEVADTPDKCHPHSDVVDATQYACLHHDGGEMFGRQVGARRALQVAPAPMRWAV